ncbi:hypothetical protein Tco_1454412, partial [Tanacetum coccineum]
MNRTMWFENYPGLVWWLLLLLAFLPDENYGSGLLIHSASNSLMACDDSDGCVTMLILKGWNPCGMWKTAVKFVVADTVKMTAMSHTFGSDGAIMAAYDR